jgi:plastocyanin
MSRRAKLLVLAAAAVMAAGTLLIPAAASPAPARLQVTEKEFSLILSRLRVHQGQAIVQVLNFGMDNHDLVIQSNAGGSKPIHFSQLSPGAHATRTLKLAPGKYTLWCSLPGHRKLGMVAPLTVTR